MLWQLSLRRKEADSFILCQCRGTAIGFSMIHGCKLLILRGRAFLEHTNIVITTIFVQNGSQQFDYESMLPCSP
jgi:hypothetical protein